MEDPISLGTEYSPDGATAARLIDRLTPFNELGPFVAKLKENKELRFDVVFHDRIGNYLMKCFLVSEYSLSKAIFFSDVEMYRQMRDEKARLCTARKIVDAFVIPSSSPIEQTPGKPTSVFGMRVNPSVVVCPLEPPARPSMRKERRSFDGNKKGIFFAQEPGSMLSPATNPVGVYGQVVVDVISKVKRGDASPGLFDSIASTVLSDLEFDSFPRFLQSRFFEQYIRAKHYASEKIVTTKDFKMMQVLGQGVSSRVRTTLKTDTGTIYAAKVFDKRWVQGTDSLGKVLRERDLLISVGSPFVIGLKYAIQDEDNLYFILDLMTGDHLKRHLGNKPFTEIHARFHAAEILLGLEQIHTHDIIFRDLNLENVLLDDQGHCKISDFGLAVKTTTPITGYAGTPGNIAPEILKGDPYTKAADFFSYGVIVYKMISGHHPFDSATTCESEQFTDKSVLEQEPFFPSEIFSPEAASILRWLLEKDPVKRLGGQSIDQIKLHPWFTSIDWTLLEGGYVQAPHIPVIKENVERFMQGMEVPPEEGKYRNSYLTEAFKASLSSFDYQSPIAISNELAEAMTKADHGVNFEMFSKRKQTSTAKKKPSSCNVM